MISYLIVFLTAVVVNVIPFFMPPTWLVLAFFYHNSAFDPLLLALMGAIGSTTGRVMLTYMGTYSRRFLNAKHKKSMDVVGEAARHNPVKSFLVTFAFALSPFPSNVYFIAAGLSKARTVPIFLGFFFGRLISYFTLILGAQIIFNGIDQIFTSRLLQGVLIDAVGIAFMLVFVVVDWETLVKKRKVKFVPLRLRHRIRKGHRILRKTTQRTIKDVRKRARK